jgi:formylglycine-generating enzyme required for sulfatase activity
VKTVTTEWEEIRKFWHKKKNSALISAVALFLDKYEKHPLGNPLEAEARKALDDLKTKMDIDKSGINWVLIPGGSFMMGSMDGSSDERPVHRVVVKDFYMSKTEVTVGQYRKCVEAGGCSEPSDKNDNSHCNWGYSDREDHPINCVDWKQARTFAKWVGGDLPSEAQWEYASRSGGKDIKYPWGNAEPRCEIANYHGCGGNTIPVCSKIGGNTTQGLCDMGGNVWEWVLDEYHSSYNGAPSEAIGWCSDRGCDSDTSDIRVYRGGSWDYSDSILRSADRTYHLPALHLYSVGFRVSLVHKRQFIDLEGF